MDRLFIFFLSFGFICYFLGVVFAQKTISIIFRFLSLFEEPTRGLKEFLKSQNDRAFLFMVIMIPVATYYFFHKSLDLDKLIQCLIVEGTFFAVIYSVLIKDSASKYRNRPILDVYFNDRESYCYHKTVRYDTTPTWSGKNITVPVPTYYISMEVINKGKTMLKNVEVVLHKVNSKKLLSNPFLPLNLNWSFKGEGLDIPPHRMSRLVNIFEIGEPDVTYNISKRTSDEGGGPDVDRYRELSNAFRSCSVKPNTLSDIFPIGEYIFDLIVTASNAEPKTVRVKVFYDGKWDNNTSVEDMRNKYLVVKLLS